MKKIAVGCDKQRFFFLRLFEYNFILGAFSFRPSDVKDKMSLNL
jgi:hypothetical protein